MQKILAIDDKTDNLITLTALLKNLMPGCTMITAQSGQEGIEKAGAENPDVILLDIIMPDMDGFETCRRLKADERTRQIPVIMITAIRTDPRSRIKGLEMGADAFLAKPVDEHELVSQVKVALRIKKAEDALRAERDSLEKKVQERTAALREEINERKRAEEELRASKQIIQGIMDSIPVRVFWKDENLVFLGCNAAFASDAGFSDPDDLIGKDDYQMVWRDQADLYCHDDRQVIDSGCPRFFIEEPQTTPAGGIITLLTSKIPLRGSKGEISGILGTYMDITDRKRAEEEKRSLEERLQRAEKMEALGTLAGGVAHDLNNVLGIVVGYSELLLDEIDESSPLRDDVVKIMEGGQRSAAIVQDLLTLARRGVSGRKVLNLNRLIRDFEKSPEWEKLRSYHPSLQIKTDLEADLLNISASFVHLEKAIFNLVSNACEAMAKGGTVTIRTTNRYLDKPICGYDNIHEGDYIVLSVSDTGEGIPESDLKRIFEPFYTKKIMGRSGTGLGLAVVWGTVKDHQGYINVESEEGKGTIFTLYFPVAREDITTESLSVPINEYMGKGESILVVDDVKEQRDLAAAMLKKLNYKVANVSSGEDAVEYLREHESDLMVLDMIMDPGMDGLDTYRKVLEIHPKQKAIIVSGFSESDRVHDAQTLGAGAYVRKPYVIEKLGLAVREELDRK